MNRSHSSMFALVLSFVLAVASPGSAANQTTLATFNGFNGNQPRAGLVADGAGNLYGTTYMGGTAGGFGTVYKIDASTKQLTTLVNFNGTNGAGPEAGLIIDSSGNLYGTTTGVTLGGFRYSNDGTVFKVAAGTNELSTLVSFNKTNGAFPVGGLVSDAEGNLYGTTQFGGNLSVNKGAGAGTVFSISADTHSLTTLGLFNGNNGAYPTARLIIDAEGNLLGTTNKLGSSAFWGVDQYPSTVFEIANGTDSIIKLASMNTPVYAGLTSDASGNLFGVMMGGGFYGLGAIFVIEKIAPGVYSPYNIIANFDGMNGESPQTDLLIDADGNLYGTSTFGGTNNKGTVFKLTAGSNTITTLATFDGTNGSNPYGGLIADAAGNLYGTTAAGNGFSGSVFQITGTGFVVPETSSILLSFVGIATVVFPCIKRVRETR